ncbi:hypothetical protein [Flavobacterium sp. ASW18X]|uniref:hypothetical protein n=1 Tax=Flavobacterium sp. ASW18X TaxID=2572595 RepID=UPI0010ADD20B|nr:hypothetical protein [Flavobacterium sp. ASW18X]TKD65382.1 hypothetical protein FBT53_07580 [Flavobacterium sp. ASW18X]
MKAKLFALGLYAFLMSIGLQAQESFKDQVNVGTIMTIGEPSGSDFKYVNVPKKNFIIKKGGIANLSSIHYNAVEVTDIKTNKQGATEVRFKKVDGKKFFNAYRTLTADLNGAVNNEELLLTAGNKKEMSK